MSENRNYWMHRISLDKEIKQPLLEKEGLLLTAWGCFSTDGFLDNISGKSKQEFDEIYNKALSALPHNRYFLYMFINEFKKGDYVLVPGANEFSVYEIISDAPMSKDHIMDCLKAPGDYDLERTADGKYCLKSSKKELDLGFFWKVKPIELNISRELHAEDALRKRLKFAGTNVALTDLADEVNDAIQRHRENKPLELRQEMISGTYGVVCDKLQKLASDGILEKVVKYYMQRIGATTTENQCAAGVVADFDVLQVRIIIQVNQNLTAVDENAVQQIVDAKNAIADSSHTIIPWVIALCDDFTDKAQLLADKEGVRLIGGTEFASSLLEVGFGGLAI